MNTVKKIMLFWPKTLLLTKITQNPRLMHWLLSVVPVENPQHWEVSSEGNSVKVFPD